MNCISVCTVQLTSTVHLINSPQFTHVSRMLFNGFILLLPQEMATRLSGAKANWEKDNPGPWVLIPPAGTRVLV